MIRKFVLDNFMAHGHTELDLDPGMTVLTGPNNTGKSALVEGLRCLATNPPPKAFIRHGADKARVEAHLEDEDGKVTKVAWVRRKASAVYELTPPGPDHEPGEPEVFAKLGKGHVPEEVRAALRLDPVTLETGQDVDVHIGNQREPIFLLNMPPSAAAAFFAASTESAHLLAMQNLLKRRVQEARREEKALAGRIADLEQDLDSLAGLPHLALAVEQAGEQERALEEKRQQLPRLAELLDSLQSLSRNAARARERGTVLGKLTPPARPAEARDLARTIQEMAGVERSVRILSKRTQSLSGLVPLPDTAVTADLSRTTADLEDLQTRADRLQKRVRFLAGLQPSPTPRPVADLSGLVHDLEEMETARQDKDKHLKKITKERESLDREIENRLAELGECPLCHARLDSNAFLGRGKD